MDPEAVLRARPDVVLTDELDRSPRVLELIGGIDRGRPRTNALVLTLAMDPGWLEQIFDAGAVAAISKATPPAALVTLVRETLRSNINRVHRASVLPRNSTPDQAAAQLGSPTPRELEVLRLAASGSANGEIVHAG